MMVTTSGHRAIRHRAIRKFNYLRHYLTSTPTALDAHSQHLQGNSQHYQKFIIFAHERSGSSMAISTLKKHPQILGFGELFNAGRVGFDNAGYDNYSSRARALRNKYPLEFLDRQVFAPYPAAIGAVGFKLFPEHIDNELFQAVWSWLGRHREIKVITLRRENLLATYASLLVARKDGRFSIKSEAERSQTTIRMNPQRCVAEFQKRQHYNQKISRCLHHHDVMDMTYEALAVAPHRHLQTMQNFVGVVPRHLDISVIKQETRPLSAIIENYDEVRRYLMDTEWAYLVEELAVAC